MIRLGRGMGHMGEMTTTVTVDPVVVNGQTTNEPGSVITGDKPPLIPKSWWPWIIAGGALGAIWWFTRDDEEEGEFEDERPFDE